MVSQSRQPKPYRKVPSSRGLTGVFYLRQIATFPYVVTQFHASVMKTQHPALAICMLTYTDSLGIARRMANNGEINQEFGVPEDRGVTVIVKDMEPAG